VLLTSGHISLKGMELDDKATNRPPNEYSHEFATKCLLKVNINSEEEALGKSISYAIH
jgi:hypothetical protein